MWRGAPETAGAVWCNCPQIYTSRPQDPQRNGRNRVFQKEEKTERKKQKETEKKETNKQTNKDRKEKETNKQTKKKERQKQTNKQRHKEKSSVESRCFLSVDYGLRVCGNSRVVLFCGGAEY